jgi:hypothetical protein
MYLLAITRTLVTAQLLVLHFSTISRPIGAKFYEFRRKKRHLLRIRLLIAQIQRKM